MEQKVSNDVKSPISPIVGCKRTGFEASLDDGNFSSLSQKYGFKINDPPKDRPVRIYCDGIYDMFHFGHAKALEQAKKAFPDVYLLVGVCNDEETHKRKGRTVMKDTERYESVRHCKWVDEVIEAAPWTVTQEFLDFHQIDYVAHDAEPYQSTESGDVYAFVKSQGRFFPTERTSGISTSDLITRIVRDYDKFLRRNLERGVSFKELNISFIKKQQIKTQLGIERVKANLVEHLELWEQQSHHFITDFAGLFSVEAVLVSALISKRIVNISGLMPSLKNAGESFSQNKAYS
ncbi:hypothetical protein EDC96DRAFT_515121 [Choanephora cucurbitarum]|nr:hypothetical protein EDC96DRAFT_515121 [Choanephora cucurbitarum]